MASLIPHPQRLCREDPALDCRHKTLPSRFFTLTSTEHSTAEEERDSIGAGGVIWSRTTFLFLRDGNGCGEKSGRREAFAFNCSCIPWVGH